jgi:hypothetical protein
VAENQKCIEQLERNRRDDEQIYRRNAVPSENSDGRFA